jgi:hydroxymethylglutaryl-CoA synthase
LVALGAIQYNRHARIVGSRGGCVQVGIDKIAVYGGRLALDLGDLAQRRGKDVSYVRTKLMCDERAVFAPYEDAVTMAVNATKLLLENENPNDIELVIVGTETAVDMGKAAATWVQGLCGISNTCRTFEVKQACYGATGALKMAMAWIASGQAGGKKALIIGSDFSRTHLGDSFELTMGGCAVAMLVSAEPRVLEIDQRRFGYWSKEIADTFRPTVHLELGEGELSIYSYLDALEGSWTDLERRCGELNYDNEFNYHLYHSPFVGMTFQAHQAMLGRFGLSGDKDRVRESFRRKVQDAMAYLRRLGASYGASTYVELASLIDSNKNIKPGERVSLFAYGSGCQGEFTAGTIAPRALETVRDMRTKAQLDERRKIGVDEYEVIEYARRALLEDRNSVPRRDVGGNLYDEAFRGRGLLVLDRIEDYRRFYVWS